MLTPGATGECSDDDWLEVAKPNILTRMAAYEVDQIEFSILGLVRDPLPDLVHQLAVNVRSLEILNERALSLQDTDPAGSDPAPVVLKETVLGPDSSLSLTREAIDAALVSEEARAQYQAGSADQLRQHQQELSNAQRGLREHIREEQQSQWADDDHAAGRRHDYGPAVRTWLQFLARKQLLEVLHE